MAGPGSDAASQKRGTHIYMGGIGMQEAFILLFLCLIIKFHLDQIRAERIRSLAMEKTRWRPLIYALYSCLACITFRIIFRLIEFSAGQGENNPLPHTERYFYILDGCPMLLAIFVWNANHPGRFMQGPDAKLPRSWLSRSGPGPPREGQERLQRSESLRSLCFSIRTSADNVVHQWTIAYQTGRDGVEAGFGDAPGVKDYGGPWSVNDCDMCEEGHRSQD
ncbi:hypothetical protein ANO11243_042510 [Dothideomycetidae sp. 11243]|nr:hypothetical protein ANO11243_042510 [fungal sp. No.11243]